jgi:membrane protein
MQPGQQLERGAEGFSRTRRRPSENLKAGGSQNDRGRRASTPSEIPPRGWVDVLWRVYHGISDHRVLAIAAGVTFYSLLAIFPAIAALVALYSLFADPGTIRSQLDSLSNLLPGGALAVIGDQITRVSAQGQATLGFAFVGGFLISVWSANAAIKALFDALNIVYEEHEKRGFFRLNAVSLSFTLIGIALVLVAIAAMVVLPAALAYLDVASKTEGFFKILRWPLLFVVVSLAISLIYRYGPSRERAQWRWLTWGSAFAAVAWLVMSILFSWYAESFGRFNETYGSLGAVIGFMIWMWLSNVVLLIGAELNAEMEHQTLVDTTTGRPEPMGSRNAEMADTVGPSRG